MNISERENAWNEFEKTGLISSYLRYKGITEKTRQNGKAESRIEDGEPIGYN